VLLTTHQIAEAEEICDRVAIMQDGCIKAVGTLEELRKTTNAEGSGLSEIFQRVTEPEGESDVSS
jgi:ABC-2 type transport system ATP-binding protein